MIELKFKFSEKATKIDKIFTVNLTICSNRQIDGEDFVNFFGLLRKNELYLHCKCLQGFTGTLQGFSAISAGKTL